MLIRFHALGDVALTFPAAAALRLAYPGCRIDYLTGEPAADLVRGSGISSEVMTVPSRISRLLRFSDSIRIGMRLRRRQYDVVIDLQRNTYSRLVRQILRPRAWSEFDRYSPLSARARVASTFSDAGFPAFREVFSLPVDQMYVASARALLVRSGWDERGDVIVLNPAGLWSSRNWPLESYVATARILSGRPGVRFLLLGTDRIRAKAMWLKAEIGDLLIDLCGQTSPGEALAALTFASGMVSEDSGLMHMGWASGLPTVALFGSSYHIWSAPVGDHCRTLHSGDLPCGACGDAVCRFGDTHCLTRRSPEQVAENLEALLAWKKRRSNG